QVFNKVRYSNLPISIVYSTKVFNEVEERVHNIRLASGENSTECGQKTLLEMTNMLTREALKDGILVNSWRVEWNQHLLRLFLSDNPGESKSVQVSDNGLSGTGRLVTPICFWSAINTGGLLRTPFLGSLVAHIVGGRLTEALP